MDEREAETADWLAAAGDRRAFGELVGAHERQALAVAYAIVGCGATAADVVQEAMLRAWQRLGELQDGSRFGPWLCRIVRNAAIDSIRRRPRGHVELQPTMRLAQAEVHPAEQNETKARIQAAMALLDEVSRIIVALRYYDNCSSRQIGEVVGLSPAAVDMRLSRARGILRDRLNGEFEQHASAGMSTP